MVSVFTFQIKSYEHETSCEGCIYKRPSEADLVYGIIWHHPCLSKWSLLCGFSLFQFDNILESKFVAMQFKLRSQGFSFLTNWWHLFAKKSTCKVPDVHSNKFIQKDCSPYYRLCLRYWTKEPKLVQEL